jgi:hypothetical protein
MSVDEFLKEQGMSTMKQVVTIDRKSGERKTISIDTDLVEKVFRVHITDRVADRKIEATRIEMHDGEIMWSPEDVADLRRRFEIITPQPEGSPVPPDLLNLASRQAPGSKTISVK